MFEFQISNFQRIQFFLCSTVRRFDVQETKSPRLSGIRGNINFLTMPAGVTLEKYAKFMLAALATMFVGAQAVHLVYRPLDDLPAMIEAEKRKINRAQAQTTQNSQNREDQ